MNELVGSCFGGAGITLGKIYVVCIKGVFRGFAKIHSKSTDTLTVSIPPRLLRKVRLAFKRDGEFPGVSLGA